MPSRMPIIAIKTLQVLVSIWRNWSPHPGAGNANCAVAMENSLAGLKKFKHRITIGHKILSRILLL